MIEKYLRELFDTVEINESQPAITCSSSTMDTPKQYVKSVQTLQKRHQNDVIDTVLVYLMLLTHCSGVFITDYGQVNAN